MEWPEPFLKSDHVQFEDMWPLLKELVMHDIVMEPADLLQWGEWGGWQDLEKLTVSDPRDVAYFQGCEDTLRSITIFKLVTPPIKWVFGIVPTFRQPLRVDGHNERCKAVPSASVGRRP